MNSLVATARAEGEATLAARGFRRDDPKRLKNSERAVRYWARESLLGSLHLPSPRKMDSGAAPGAAAASAENVRRRDRWAIAAYVRALQLARHAPIAELPAIDRRTLEALR